jgi:O-antigen ligase
VIAACVFLATAVAFAVAALRRPSLAVAGLVLVDPFALYRYAGPTAITLPKVAIVGFAIGLALRRPSLNVLRERGALLTALAATAVVLATALSYFQADFKVPVVRETLKAAEYLLVFVLCVAAIADDRSDRDFRNACFAIGAIVALLAIAQEFTAAHSSLWVVVGYRALTRVAGPLEGPNQLAGYLSLLLPVMAAYLLRGRATLLGWTAFAIVAAALALTFSRAGAAGAIAALAVVLARVGIASRRSWLTAVGVPLAAGVIAVLLAGGDIARFWSTSSELQPEGLGTRGQLWTAAYRLWQAHPLLGIGAGNYELELSRVGYPELRTHSNGEYLQALVEGGIPLLAALLWATLQPIWSLVRGGSRHPAVVGALGALAGLAVHQVVDSMTFFPKVGMMAWVLAGAGIAFAQRDAA